MVEEIVITGILNGGIFALLAIGFSLVFGVARIINLAHTAFYMIAAYILYALFDLVGLPIYVAATVALIGSTLTGVVTYKTFIERVREHEVTVLLITACAAMVLQELLFIFFGGTYKGAPTFLPGFAEILGVRVPYQHLFTLVAIVVALLITSMFLYRTRLGLAIRATAQDREIANLMGMHVPRVCMITMAVSILLSSFAGVMIAPIYIMEPTMWMHPLLIVCAVVILGGLGSIKGSIVGAFVLGFAESLVVYLIPTGSFLRGAISMAVMLAVLLIRPEGLFGVAFEEERL